MKLQAIASVVAAMAGLSAVSVAQAASKKSASSSTGITTSTSKQGTLVAMNGSGSVGQSSSSNGSYVGLSILPFQYVGLKTTRDKTTSETPKTSLRTIPQTLDFYGNFGAWHVRPEFSLDADVPSSVSVTYALSDKLSVGGYLSYSRATLKNVDKSEGVASAMIFGPRAFYDLEVAGMPVEVDGVIAMISEAAETIKDGTTTKTRDISGYVFQANAKLVRELGSNLDGYAAVGLGYSSKTDKTTKDAEVSESGISLSIVPAGLRYKF
jgi:hypothetical protein